MKPTDSYAIAALMMQMEGWERAGARCCIPIYGQQRMYRRIPVTAVSDDTDVPIPDFLD